MSNSPVAAGQVRRARLERLREELDPLAAAEVRSAVRALLRRPLILPEGRDAEAYHLIRRHQEWIATWFAHHADWSLSVTAEVARLRKVPAWVGDASRGAVEPRNDEPFTRRRYVLICLALATLERSDRQVTLGRLAEGIGGALAADPAFAESGVVWSLETASERRDFVQVVRLLLELGVLRRVQGDEERFIGDRESDVLYGVARPVLTVLLASRRSPSLITEEEFAARLRLLVADTGAPDTPEARNRAMRCWMVRRLLDDPVMYYEDLDTESRVYLDRQRSFILRELGEATGLEAEVRAEGLALVDLDGDCTDLGLPEEGTEGHLTILLAGWLATWLRERPDPRVTVEAVRLQTAKLIRRHRHHWRKEVSEKGAETWLAEVVLGNLSGLGLIERRGGEVIPRPALGRFALRLTSELEEAAESVDLFAAEEMRSSPGRETGGVSA
ncbi:MAG: TIGR02678 family protein [Limisphaerales bacterium]